MIEFVNVFCFFKKEKTREEKLEIITFPFLLFSNMADVIHI